ncbi:MAG: hypothetical protein WC554_18375 [Clostridia bacterium]|jgi:hypothetical protein
MAIDFDKDLRPGDAINISPDEVRSGVLRPDARWSANIASHQLYTALMVAGRRMLKPPAGTRDPIDGSGLTDCSYLRRLPGEGSSEKADAGGETDLFIARLRRAAHDPVASRIIWVYVDNFSRQDVDRTSARERIGSVLDDVDGCGTAVEDWIPFHYANGLAQGWMVGVVELPPPAEQAPPSRLHEELAGRKPYVTVYKPSRVWHMERDSRGFVTDLLCRDGVDTFRHWTPGYVETLNAKGESIGEAQFYDFGFAPAAVFIANDPDDEDPTAPLGESAMSATALVDLMILQHLSLLDNGQLKTGFSILHGQMDPEENKAGGGQDLVLGDGSVWLFNGAAAWLAPPPHVAAGSRAHCEWLESLAYKIGGVHRRSQDSVEAHSGLALDWENAPIYAVVHRWARRLRAWETRLWQLCAFALGQQDLSGLAPVYPDDFSTRPVEQDLGFAKAMGDIYGDSMPGWIAVCRDALVRRAMMRLIGHLSDVKAAVPTTLGAEAAVVPVDGVTDVPVELETAENAVPPDSALNGAQSISLLEILDRVATKRIPRQSGIEALVAAFPVDHATAEAIMGEIGRGFFAEATAPAATVNTYSMKPGEKHDEDADA